MYITRSAIEFKTANDRIKERKDKGESE